MVVIADEVVNRLIYLMEMARDVQFEIGDELIRLVDIHGSKAEVISYLAGQLNVSASVLYDYYRVAEKWSPAMREIYQSLDWTIYRNSDPSDPDDVELLDQAIDEGWNATKFKEEKYPSMKDPMVVLGKIKALIKRNFNRFPRAIQVELSAIMNRLEQIEGYRCDIE